MSHRVQVECPNCESPLTLTDESKLGRKVRCPECSEVFVAEVAESPMPRASSTRAGGKKRTGKKEVQSTSPALMIAGGGAALLLAAGVCVWIFVASGEPEVFHPNMVASQPNAPTTGTASGMAANPIGAPPATSGAAPSSPTLSTAEPLVAQTISGIELEPRTVLDGRVSLLVPKSFAEMSRELLEAKYPMARRPEYVLTNEAGSVNLAFNHTRTPLTAVTFQTAVPQIEQTFRGLVDSVDWIGRSQMTIAGAPWFTFEFRSAAVDTKIHNLMIGGILENRLLLVAFNATESEANVWLPVANAIVKSLRVVAKAPPQSPPSFTDSNTFIAAAINGVKPKVVAPVKALPAAALGTRTATINLRGLANSEQSELLREYIRQSTKCTSSSAKSFGQYLSLTINGVGDLQILAEALDLGNAIEINDTESSVTIQVDAQKVAELTKTASSGSSK